MIKMWTGGWRDRTWADLDRPWDIIVVGGGITGAGVLREAVRAGWRTLLLEGGDFAAGTSSRSSKLVHGGLRYLRSGQLKTTLSSVHERERLLKEGKGLINPIGFLYAGYEGDPMPLWLFGAGLAVYDLLGRRWGHKRYPPEGIAGLAPGLRRSGLVGGYRYFDAQTDDARLVLRVIREAVAQDGVALNYARVERLLRQRNGQVCGVAVRDLGADGGGRTIELQAKVVINATGAEADFLRAQVDRESRLRCLRGSHLVLPAARLPVLRSLSFLHPWDGRPVFALPWEGVTLFGTTDVDHQEKKGKEPAITSEEVAYLLAGLEFAFPDHGLGLDDVQSTFSGVRAVVDTGKADPSKESREHVLWSESGLLTVTGGKLTTFRVMAHDALRQAARQLGEPSHRFSRGRVLNGADESDRLSDLQPSLRQRLVGRYGAEAPLLVDAARPGELDTVADSQVLWAELRWAARAEGVVRLDDLLLRRVRLGLLLPEGGLPHLDRIRDTVREELGWDTIRWQEESAAYAERWRRAYSLPNALISSAESLDVPQDRQGTVVSER